MSEILRMGIRQRGYWLRQANATRRELIQNIAFGVRIGMASSEDYEKAMETLGVESDKKSLRDATWNMLFFLKGGQGV